MAFLKVKKSSLSPWEAVCISPTGQEAESSTDFVYLLYLCFLTPALSRELQPTPSRTEPILFDLNLILI